MKQIDLATGKEAVLLPEDTVACAIGNFDGVHIGHKKLILHAAARPNGTCKSAVWTFTEPSSHCLDRKIPLLSTMEERLDLFRALGIDIVFLEDFKRIQDMDAKTFAAEILYRDCHVRVAVCGFNFRYGKNATGTAETLSETFHSIGASVTVMPPCKMEGVIVSSSEIRAALAAGDTEHAAKLLGRYYSLDAAVCHGKRLGHTLGFPTANQQFPEAKAIPRFGVYATRVFVDGKQYYGVSNVGIRPTVENTQHANCETYILDFTGDLYGKSIQVQFCRFLRPEEKFSDSDTLQKAILHNIAETREYFHITEHCL